MAVTFHGKHPNQTAANPTLAHEPVLEAWDHGTVTFTGKDPKAATAPVVSGKLRPLKGYGRDA